MRWAEKLPKLDSEMTISFNCPKCSKPFNVPDQLAGKKSKCGCGHQFVIPAAAQQRPAQKQAAPQPPLQQPSAPQQPAAPANPLGGMPAGNPLGGLPAPPAGNPLGAMPPVQPGGNPLGGLPAGGAFPPASGANPLGGMPVGAPGMQPAAGGWNTPASHKGKAKGKKSGGSKKGLWIGISIGAVLLIGGGLTAFLLMEGDDPAGVADSNAAITQANQTSTGATGNSGGGVPQGGGPGDMSGMMSGMSDPSMGGGMDPGSMGEGMMDPSMGGGMDPGSMGEGMMDPSMGGGMDPGSMGEGMMDPGAGMDPSQGGNYGAGEGTDPSLDGGDPMGNFGAGPGTDPSLGGGDPSLGGGNPMGNFGAGPGTDPSLGGSDPSLGGGNPFGNPAGGGGGVVGDDFNSISNALKSNDIDLISQANFKTLKAIATTLEKIYDGPTALAQVDRLKQLEQLVKLSSAAMKRVKPTAAQKRQIQQKYAVQASQALSAYNKEVARITKNGKIPQVVKLQLQKTMQLGK